MQTKVNIFQAIGMVGEFFSDALKSVNAYIVRGTGYTPAVFATGTVTVSGTVSAGDTVNVGGDVYTAVASGAVGNQFNVGANANATAANIAAVIGGVATATSSTNVVTITASIAGVVGNSITLSVVSAGLTASGATLSSGAEASGSNNATIGRAFTFVSGSSTDVTMGGTGAFAGIFVNPKNQTIYNNLTATLSVPDGSQGAMCQSGYIFVSLANNSVIGDKIYFVNATGELGAGTATTGQTQIVGAKVILGGTAGSTVKIGIIPQTT